MKSSSPASRQNRRHASPLAAPHPGYFLLAAVIAVLGIVGTYLFYIRTTTGQYIDESALDEAARAQAVIGTPSATFLDALPAISVVIAAVVVVVVMFARRRWLSAGIAVTAMVAANLCTQLIKSSLPDRPDRGVVTLDLNSLPSGHSTLAASAAAAVFLVVSPSWRPAVGFFGGSYAVFAGVATLINQWHRPADVITAFLVVAFWTVLAGLAIMRTGSSWNVWDGYGEHWAASRIWPFLSVLAGVLAAVLAVLVLRELTPAGGNQVSTTNYLWVGVALIVICGYLVTVAGTLLFGLEARQRARPPLSRTARSGAESR
ncbi:phosphatase PAP2 family protein [Paenarthrobacter sp. PH39-S1]|uniref:phosphatase PAP2 family protein n=1 Tax=Paenarthrobacter sp. PH39-S1 TaxID=3046204 RepID=UPI0024BBE177|nr:phosphatase PAP2 family protein [Paenarthrobacter sp. PH39-S1]MDJ0355085.1 phosphatase PAP2 family protein [Paenarthrobacter sp. PH39-S1]